jgi:hypothetical protein
VAGGQATHRVPLARRRDDQPRAQQLAARRDVLDLVISGLLLRPALWARRVRCSVKNSTR